ncbi:DJ-1/PfpI family protein [Alkaliphilus serpentinus]|uniref:DJ-1/PfpI family protein n=1 Tax=Alkaliphilus serpentinus TaxID=1482731 RepID=A0A833MAT4_9FIRM|nr:DJ-1/PfpI family protein [Alkaliphilus serpentinus]KAB3531533.1 DJ-1/PfpI family protein [Alkaliphilus serpentinus]
MKILLFLAKGFEMTEASGFIDVFGWDKHYNKGQIDVVTCGFTREVISTFNIPIRTDLLIDEVNVEDYVALAIPGGFGEYGFYQEAYDEGFLNLINEFNAANKPIATVCVGSLPVGKSGALKGRRGTAYHLAGGNKQRQLEEMGVTVIKDEAIVVDGNIISSWCPETAIEVAFKLLEMLTSKDHCKNTRMNMGFR